MDTAAVIIGIISLILVLIIVWRQDKLIKNSAKLAFREKINVVNQSFPNLAGAVTTKNWPHAGQRLDVLVRDFEAAWEVRKNIPRGLKEEMASVLIQGSNGLSAQFNNLPTNIKGKLKQLLEKATDLGANVDALKNLANQL